VSDHHRHEEAIKYLEDRCNHLDDRYGLEAIHNIRKRIKWLEDFKDSHSYANFLVENLKAKVEELEADLQEYKEGNRELHEFNRDLSAQIHAELIPAQKQVEELEADIKRLREEREFIRTGQRERCTDQ
jgi:chromosome segregation ATPase